MTRLRPRRKQSKEEVTRCSTSRGANVLEGMVLKKKSDHSLAPNKKLRIQWNHAAWTILAVNCDVDKDKTSCLAIICFSLPILFLRDQGKDYPVKVTGDAQTSKCSKSQACEGTRVESRLNRSDISSSDKGECLMDNVLHGFNCGGRFGNIILSTEDVWALPLCHVTSF